MTVVTKKTKEEQLEERKVKALEKIAYSLDMLTIWFEEIDKDEWDERIQFYLYEWFKTKVANDGESEEEVKSETKKRKTKK